MEVFTKAGAAVPQLVTPWAADLTVLGLIPAGGANLFQM